DLHSFPTRRSSDLPHVVSSVMILPLAKRRVPPQARTNGLDAGKSTCCPPSFTPSAEPSSPDAARTVTPSIAASLNTSLNESMDCCVQLDSAPPQLMDTTDGRFFWSWTAAVIASRKPLSVLWAK